MPSNKPARRSALDKAAEQVPSLARRPTDTRRPDEAGKTWDERNKPASFRIREVDAERLEALGHELGLSKDALATALLWAALDALAAGDLQLEVDTVESEVKDKRGRVRYYARKVARPVWASADREFVGNDPTA